MDLVSRIEYDLTVKTKFITELNDGLYEKHVDFLSNPLLLTMMLLTYEQLAEIPEKIHIFYEQAFDTLFHKHDALKSLYKRKSYSELSIDEFKKIFSTFCIVTFSDRKISFSYGELIEYLDKAIAIEKAEVNSDDFFNDLIKSVCIMQKDGNTYTFSHRSFQEYFAAYFISRSQSINTQNVLNKMSMMHFRDSVISMVFELNREKFETEWILPELQETIEETKSDINNGDVLGYLSCFYDGFSSLENGVGMRFSSKLSKGHFASWLYKIYPNESKIFFPETEDDEIIKARGKKEIELFYKNTSMSEANHLVKFSQMPSDVEWLSETWIPEYCQKKNEFLKYLYKELKQRYLDKEKSLASLLFVPEDK